MRTDLIALAVAASASCTFAQPASFTDLGNRTATQTFTQVVTLTSAADIQWFRIEIPAATAPAGSFDVWTTPTASPLAATDLVDTEIGLYNPAGARAVATANFSDDNDGPGAYGQLSFGSTVARPAPTFTGLTNGLARAGADGELPAGVYYLAVGASDVVFAPTGFGVTSTHAGPRRTTLLNFDIRNGTESTPPSAVGAASLTTANAGDTVVYTVAVTPGANPVSTGITVTANLTVVGGPAAAAFLDNGLNGDSLAGDGVYSFRHPIPVTATDTTYTLNAMVADAQGRTAAAPITANITGAVTWDELTTGGADAGATLVTAQTPTGAGQDLLVITGVFAADDVDIYKLSICDLDDFSVTTRLSDPLLDTQLFLFREDGTGVVMNDDVPDGLPGAESRASTLTGEHVTAPGNYYLAVARWDMDPESAGGTIWADSPFDTNRAPDGTDPTGTLAMWTGTAGGGVYRVSLTGVCFAVASCGPADIGSIGGIPGPDSRLDNNDFIVFIDYFFARSGVADVGSTGGVAGSDNAWDNNDFVVYIDMFFSGQPDCL
ncbi:MAG TPA: GC-type dockerin domain-anchored protein [Phycisphaerales bacterium]|nr:GC-type dockerin domain-anchored protein [Phycisphaerales bacterium]